MLDYLEPLGVTQHRARRRDQRVPPRRINEIVHGKRAVTADTALRLARLLRHQRSVLAQSPDAASNSRSNATGSPAHSTRSSHSRPPRSAARVVPHSCLTQGSSEVSTGYTPGRDAVAVGMEPRSQAKRLMFPPGRCVGGPPNRVDRDYGWIPVRRLASPHLPLARYRSHPLGKMCRSDRVERCLQPLNVRAPNESSGSAVDPQPAYCPHAARAPPNATRRPRHG